MLRSFPEKSQIGKVTFFSDFQTLCSGQSFFCFVLLAFLEWERTQSKEILASHWCNSFLICYYVVLLKRTDGRGLAHEKKCLPCNRAFFSKPFADATLFFSFPFSFNSREAKTSLLIQVLGTEIDTTNLVVMVINGQYVSSVSASSSIERQR